jgi:hypothetical protein
MTFADAAPRKAGSGGRQPHLPVFAKAKIARQFRAVCRGESAMGRLFCFCCKLIRRWKRKFFADPSAVALAPQGEISVKPGRNKEKSAGFPAG